MRKGLVYRSAAVSRGKVTCDEVIKGTLALWAECLNIKTLIDLRTNTEKRSDEHDKQVEKVYPTVPLTQKRAAEGRQRFHTNVLSYSTLFKGFVLPASPGTKARVLRAFFAAGEDTGRLKSAKAMLCREVVSPRGLVSLYILMLSQSAALLKKVLMLCSDPQNHPVLFHCSSGKDRTGLIAALIQSVCGVSEEEILDSYADSETYLAPVLELIAEEDRKRGLSEEFDGTPRHAMEKTFEYIKESYGDVRGYLVAIGFTHEHQRQLREALMVDPESDEEYSDGDTNNEDEIEQKRGYDKIERGGQAWTAGRAPSGSEISRLPTKQRRENKDAVLRSPKRSLDSSRSSTL